MLIVIESGSDASGKATQTKRLEERLRREGYDPLTVRFPDYESSSSALVKLYLGGAFGERPDDVGAYAASTFFAVDRYASYRMQWREDYLAGRPIIADRYTTSNMVHQAVKIESEEERSAFVDWLADFEFGKLGLPVPDLVIFLDVPPEITADLLEERKKASPGEKDIHEGDAEYLTRSYHNARWVAERMNWQIIDCVEENKLMSIEAIHERVFARVITAMEGEE
jgi:dTMP kinase